MKTALEIKDLSKDELIEHLKAECKRVKIQRNEYEQKLFSVWKRLNKVESELKYLTDYVNNRK